MINLFSKEGLVILESLSFTKTLYAFDFDGTLAKIVKVPSEAKMSQKTEELLRELSKMVPVAIISGRSVRDLQMRLNIRPEYLIGNHGLEGLGAKAGTLIQAQKVCRPWVKFLKSIPLESGIEIEDKIYSLAVHYRRARNKTRAKKQIKEIVKALTPPPRVINGKSVFNLLPLTAPHKGAAILDLKKIAGLKHVFYIGDDDTDEDVFSLPYDEGQTMSVRVGKKKTSMARYFVESQSDVNKLLRLLIRYHSRLNSSKVRDK